MTKTQTVKAASLALLLIVVIIFGILIHNAVNNSKAEPAPKAQPVVSGFHSPNKIRLDYGQGFQPGNVGIELFQGNSHFDANQAPITYGFNVLYINSLSVSQTVTELQPLSIGCIATNNQSFRNVSSIFQPNLTSLTLEPHQVLQSSFQVAGGCQYIGTADGKYWWDVPKFGE